MIRSTNAIVAETISIAEQYLKAFGLDTRLWRTFRTSDNPAGLRLDRLVIIRPHWRVTAEQITEFEARCHCWVSLVDANGQFTII